MKTFQLCFNIDTVFAEEKVSYCLRPSPLGYIGIVWIKDQKRFLILRIYLPHDEQALKKLVENEYPGAKEQNKDIPWSIVDMLLHTLRGGKVVFSDYCFDFTGCSAVNSTTR